MKQIPKFNKHRAFNKAVGSGKKSKSNKRLFRTIEYTVV